MTSAEALEIVITSGDFNATRIKEAIEIYFLKGEISAEERESFLKVIDDYKPGVADDSRLEDLERRIEQTESFIEILSGLTE